MSYNTNDPAHPEVSYKGTYKDTLQANAAHKHGQSLTWFLYHEVARTYYSPPPPQFPTQA